MTRGRPKQNKGPCVVCGSQDDEMIYRQLHDWSLEKTYNSPSFSSLSISLKVGDELCEKDYNELVVYDRNTRSSSKRHTDADTSYVRSGSQKKRICLSEGEYEKLLSASNSDVHDDSKPTTLPIAREIVSTYVKNDVKLPWYIDLLNLNLNNHDLARAKSRIRTFIDEFERDANRITRNLDFSSE